MRTGPDDPFPPPLATRIYAYALSLSSLPLFSIWWGPIENRSEDLQSRFDLAAWLFLPALVTAWLAYIWTRQGHHDHATVVFVISTGLVVASLLVAFA